MEHYEDGDYVCLHCQIIYRVYGNSLKCDLCNRKLRWRDTQQVKELEQKWDIENRRKGRTVDWAYKSQ